MVVTLTVFGGVWQSWLTAHRAGQTWPGAEDRRHQRKHAQGRGQFVCDPVTAEYRQQKWDIPPNAPQIKTSPEDVTYVALSAGVVIPTHINITCLFWSYNTINTIKVQKYEHFPFILFFSTLFCVSSSHSLRFWSSDRIGLVWKICAVGTNDFIIELLSQTYE